MLGLHFINTGLLSKDLGKFYGEIFNSRLGSDYDDFVIANSDMVKEFALTATEFISAAENILRL
jgi:uncharacterized protein (UPF0332 family)